MSDVGLYQLIGGPKLGELTYQKALSAITPKLSPKDKQRVSKWAAEILFWSEYGKIYTNLEKASPYRSLARVIKEFIEPKEGDIWLDVGCGSLKESELIYEKSQGKIKRIEAIDIVLDSAKEKIAKLAQVGVTLPTNLRYASITDPLPFPDNYFDGIGANLVLSYITDYKGKTGKKALQGVLQEMFRILKPGGQMVWSTPKKGVNFFWVFIASIPDMLNIYEYIAHKDITRILQGSKILKHALEIQRKGRKGIYPFLLKGELETILLRIGFIDPVWKKAFAGQVLVNKAIKPT